MSLNDFLKEFAEEGNKDSISKPGVSPKEKSVKVIKNLNIKKKTDSNINEDKNTELVKKINIEKEVKTNEKEIVIQKVQVTSNTTNNHFTQTKKIVNSNKQNSEDTLNEFYERRFIESGTDISKKEEWFSMVEKAKVSKKKTFFVSKVLKGKFRISMEDKIEILPELDTYNKKSKDLLKLKWIGE